MIQNMQMRGATPQQIQQAVQQRNSNSRDRVATLR